MNRIKQLLSRLIFNATQANTAPSVKPHSACNYGDNYYGDQRCERIDASTHIAEG